MMDKPKSEILNNIIHHVEEMRNLQDRLVKHKEELKTLARSLDHIANRPIRLNSAHYAYWMLPEIAADDISIGLLGKRRNRQFMELMGSISVGLKCDVCGETLQINSRTQMKAEIDRSRKGQAIWAEGYRHVCKDCQIRVHERRSVKHGQEKREHALKIQQLGSIRFAV